MWHFNCWLLKRKHWTCAGNLRNRKSENNIFEEVNISNKMESCIAHMQLYFLLTCPNSQMGLLICWPVPSPCSWNVDQWRVSVTHPFIMYFYIHLSKLAFWVRSMHKWTSGWQLGSCTNAQCWCVTAYGWACAKLLKTMPSVIRTEAVGLLSFYIPWK